MPIPITQAPLTTSTRRSPMFPSSSRNGIRVFWPEISPRIRGNRASPIRGSVPKRLKTRADIFLRKEDRIGSLLALSAPGRTPGFDGLSRHENRRPDRRGCLSDEGRDRGGRTAAPGVSLSRLGHLASADRAGKREETWKHRPSLLAPGHGPMRKQPGDSIERALAEAERKLERQ